MGRVRKGRKSSNLFFEILGVNRVMLNSVQNHSSIPQLSIITELSIPKTLFNYICPLLTASNSKDFKKQQKPEGCDSLLPVGNLCFSAFFFARIIHLQLSSKEKLRSAKFQKSLDAVDFSAFNFYLVISHPHMESLKGNQFSSVIHSFVGQLFQS